MYIVARKTIMPPVDPNITAAELRILKVLWELKRAATVREVRDRLVAEGPDQPAYTTVMTLMNQLAAKGALEVDKERQPFVYQPAVQREQVLGQRLKQFLHTVFDGQAGELVLRLVEEANLSADDLRRIESMIEDKETKRPAGESPRDRKSKKGRS